MMESGVLLPRALSWQLFVYGDFRLLDPGGFLNRLPNRKVEALMAVLALHRRFGIERDEICEILWPGRPEDNQRASLRQALSQLRKAVGEESVETSRSHCRLSSTFEMVCDHDDATLRASGGFMAGHEGDWFDQIRDESLFEDEPVPIGVHPLANQFLQLLTWHAAHDPIGMFEFMRARPSMGRSMPYKDISSLLGTAGEPSGYAGWAAYWRGTAEDDLQLCARLLKQAYRIARERGDLVLASEACLEIGKVYARTGKSEKAMDICRIADTVAAQAGTAGAKANAARLKATVILQWGDVAEGHRLLALAEELTDDPIEKVVIQNARAFYQASSGRFDEAATNLAESRSAAQKLGHFRIGILGGFTEAILEAVGGNRHKSISKLEVLSAKCHSIGSSQVAVYSDELLAKLMLLDGEREVGESRLSAARVARTRSRMSLTPLETKRFELLGGRKVDFSLELHLTSPPQAVSV